MVNISVSVAISGSTPARAPCDGWLHFNTPRDSLVITNCLPTRRSRAPEAAQGQQGPGQSPSNTKYLLLKRFRKNSSCESLVRPGNDRERKHDDEGDSVESTKSVLMGGQLQGVVRDCTFDSTGVTIWTESNDYMHIQVLIYIYSTHFTKKFISCLISIINNILSLYCY